MATVGCSVAIVGSGVVGASIAHHLAGTHGMSARDIILLDMERSPGQGTTGCSAAKVRDTMTAAVSRLLAGTSIAAYKDYHGEDDRLQLALMGYLWLQTATQQRSNEEAVRMMQEAGIGLSLLTASDLRRDLPMLQVGPHPNLAEFSSVADTEVVSGIFGTNCGSIDPVALAQFYVDNFRGNGGTVRWNCRVTGLKFNGSRVSGVKATEGSSATEINAEQVVLATGPYTPLLLESHPDQTSLKSGITGVQLRQLYPVQSGIFEGVSAFNGLGFPFTVLPAPLRGVYIYRHGGSHLFLGWADDRTSLSANEIREGPIQDRSIFEERALPMAAEYFPKLTLARHIGQTVAGFYDYSPGGLPIIDRLAEGLVVACGTSGRGIMMADAIGRIAAALICGDRTARLHGGKVFEVAQLSLGEGRDQEQERFSI